MRRASIASLFVVAAVFAGCGGSDEGTGSSASASGDGGEKASVRVIHPGKVNAGTWDPMQNKAYSAAAKDEGWDLQVAEAVAYGESQELFDRWGREKVDVVFSVDAGYEEALLRAAESYPDTAWVMMSGLSTTKDLPNVASYSLNWCQMGYAQGVVAALASKKGVVANVGAVKILPAELIIEGEKAGIAATGKDVKVLTEYSGDFLAGDKAAELASSLINQGADVLIGVTNGGIAAQLAARIQDEGAYYIGTYLDEKPFAEKATITSVVSDFGADYKDVVSAQLGDAFKTTQIDRGFKDDVLKLTPFNTGFEDIEDEAKKLIADMKFPAGSKCADAA